VSIYTIPLQVGVPQAFPITLGGVSYQLTFQYRNDSVAPGWFLDISDDQGNPIVQGIPLVTGRNLLAQYGYLGFLGGLYVQTIDNPDAAPTFDNLGNDAQLFWVTNP
jgi:hypothetical protein